MRASSLCFTVLLFASSAVLMAADDAPHIATETVKEFHDALAAKNKEAALALLTSDVLIFESGGAEFSREEYAGHHLGADMQFSATTDRKITDQQAGLSADIAWVLTRSTTTGNFRDKEIDSSGVETMMLRHTSEGWKIFHIHWSSRSKGN